jgi:SAM-dependent methyltransferase
MTKPLRAVIAIVAENLKLKGRVLEIGSRQEKNQRAMANLRPVFKGSEYLGVDMRSGPGVDKVINGNKLPFKDESFDVVICLETLEHADKPWLVAEEIQRVLKKSGVALVSSQQNFPIHMHPLDYFRYTPYGMAVLFGKLKQKLVIAVSPPFDDEVKLNPQAVVLVGWKEKNKKVEELKKAILENKNKISVHKPYRHRIQDAWKIFKRACNELVFKQEVEFFDR